MNGESFWARLPWGKAALLVFFLLALINLVVLDIKIFSRKEDLPLEPISESLTSAPVATTSPAIISEEESCPAACLEAISEAKAPSAQVTPVQQPVTAGPTVKEFYIPLGSGSTTSKSYTGLSGVEGVIDLANYPNIKSIIFEASMRIPTANGRAYAKLYNVTDSHDVWNSEVYAEGSAGYRAESGEINLASGRKLYRVMMKSTVGYEAILDSARIKILLK
jgi:hypothetical protein